MLLVVVFEGPDGVPDIEPRSAACELGPDRLPPFANITAPEPLDESRSEPEQAHPRPSIRSHILQSGFLTYRIWFLGGELGALRSESTRGGLGDPLGSQANALPPL